MTQFCILMYFDRLLLKLEHKCAETKIEVIKVLTLSGLDSHTGKTQATCLDHSWPWSLPAPVILSSSAGL